MEKQDIKELNFLCEEIEKTIGLKEFILYGSVVSDFLVKKELNFKDIDIAIKGKGKELIRRCRESLKKAGGKIILSRREYTIYKKEKIIIVLAEKNNKLIDLTFMGDTNKIGLFDAETIYYKWPERKIVDKFNGELAIRKRVFTCVRGVESENPYLLASRFIYLCSKYDASLRVEKHKSFINNLRKIFIDNKKLINRKSQLSLISAVFKSILSAKNRKKFVAELISSHILSASVPELDIAIRIVLTSRFGHKFFNAKSKKELIEYLLLVDLNISVRKKLISNLTRLTTRKWNIEDSKIVVNSMNSCDKLLDAVSSKNKKFLRGGSLSKVFVYKGLVIKSYSGKHKRGYEKLKKEVSYLRNIPINIKDKFPPVIEYITRDELIAYSMPHYKDFASLTDSTLNKNIKIKKIWELLKQVLEFMDSQVYLINTKKNIENFNKKFNYKRVNDSLNVLSSMDEYRYLLRTPKIRFNGVTLINSKIILNDKDFMKKADKLINLDSLNLFHGNFHLANILTDLKDFILIDPRGELYGSQDYDDAKMVCHLYIRYDEIFTDLFTLKKRNNNYKLEIVDKCIGSRYERLKNEFLEYRLKKERHPSKWLKKINLISAFHALSFCSYHARKNNANPKRVMAYYLAGLYLLNNSYNNKESFHTPFPVSSKVERISNNKVKRVSSKQ